MLRCGFRSAPCRMRQTVVRLMASAAASLTSFRASSSRVQRVAGQSWAAVLSEARLTAATRSCGGKSPRPTGPRGILQAGQAVCGKALAPEAGRVAVAVQRGGDVLVGRVARDRGPQDDAAAERQRLGRGTGAGKSLEAVPQFRGEGETRAERTGHERPPCTVRDHGRSDGRIMPCPGDACPDTGGPFTKWTSRWRVIASRMSRSTSSFVSPVATQPGRSGTYAARFVPA